MHVMLHTPRAGRWVARFAVETSGKNRVSRFVTVTFTVTSRNNQSLGASAVKTFQGQGGSIGRATENAWVLPDPTNFVSKVHAVVEVERSAFYLRDRSTNGTFVNGSDQPIGHGLRVLLKDGDRIRIGEYELVVALTSDLPSYPSTGSRQPLGDNPNRI